MLKGSHLAPWHGRTDALALARSVGRTHAPTLRLLYSWKTRVAAPAACTRGTLCVRVPGHAVMLPTRHPDIKARRSEQCVTYLRARQRLHRAPEFGS